MLAINDELGEVCRVGSEGICSGMTVAGRKEVVREGVRRRVLVMTTGDDGSGVGLGYWPAWHDEAALSTNGRCESTKRLMVTVSLLYLTVRGMAAADVSGGESYGDVGLFQVDVSTVFD